MTGDLGGSYAIAGFLFQFLNSIDRGLEVSLRLGGGGDRVLVLEPPHADAVEGGDEPRVIQYKKRSRRDWSNRQILFDMLPTLLRACLVEAADTARPVFVTSGRLQHGAALRDFLAAFAESLNTGALRVGRKTMSADAVVAEISRRIGAVAGVPEEDRETTIRGLLSRLTIEEAVSTAAVRARVMSVLLRATGSERRAKIAYDALFTFIVAQSEVAATGLSADDILQAAGLTSDVLAPILEFDNRAADATRRVLERRGYAVSRDVRGAPDLPDASIVLLVSGSGTGKTWQLAAIAERVVRRNDLVVWLDRPAGLGEACAQIVDHVWHQILRRQDETTIQSLLSEAALVLGRARPPALVVLIDQLPADAAERAGLLEFDWTAAGIRIVAAATPDQAAMAQEQVAVPAIQLGDFSQRELRDLLGRYGLSWSSVPADVRGWISRPVLSGLYVGLHQGRGPWAGESEYSLLEQLALRAQTRMRASGETGARRILADLGGQVLTSGRLDPATLPDRPSAAQLSILSAAGWLAHDAQDDLMFAHDRLRDWAVAEHLVRASPGGALLAGSLAELGGYIPQGQHGGVRAPYALMDTIWLLSRQTDGAMRLWALLDAFDANPMYRELCDDLYRHLLPTGGVSLLDSVIEALIDRLGAASEDTDQWRAAACVEGFAMAGPVSRPAIERLLQSGIPAAERCACIVLAQQPEARHLESLARLHRLAQGDPATGQEKDDALARASWKAIVKTAPLSPGWLERYFERRMGQVPGPEHLLSLLPQVQTGRAIWERHGPALVEGCAGDAEHRYWLAQNIERFGDRRFAAELEAWCRDPAMALLPAWSALCRMWPESVPALIAHVPDGLFNFTVADWFAPLVAYSSRAPLDAVVDSLKLRDPSGCSFGFALDGRAAALRDEDIGWAAARLSEALVPRPDPDLTASRLLDFFVHIDDPALIVRLRSLVPPELPERLIGHIERRLSNAGLWHDPELVGSDRLLRALGPQFAAAALTMRLTHPHPTLRWNAVREAGLVDLATIRETLEAIANAPEGADEPGRLDAVMMLAERDPDWGHARIRRLLATADRSAINEAFWIALRLPGDDYVEQAAALLPDCFAGPQVLYRAVDYLTSRNGAPVGAERVLEEALVSDPGDTAWIIDRLLSLRTAEADEVVLDSLASEPDGLTKANLGFWGSVNRPGDERWSKIAEDALSSTSTMELRHARFFYRYAARRTGRAHDQLLSDAFPTRTDERSRTMNAIAALAEVDAGLAADALIALCRLFDPENRDVGKFADELAGWSFPESRVAIFRGASHWPAPALLRALAPRGKLPEPLLVAAVEKALTSDDPGERRAAAICSSLILDRPPSPALLQDPLPAVREAAAYAREWHESRVRARALLHMMATGSANSARQAAATLVSIWEGQKTTQAARSFSRAEFRAHSPEGSGIWRAISA